MAMSAAVHRVTMAISVMAVSKRDEKIYSLPPHVYSLM